MTGRARTLTPRLTARPPLGQHNAETLLFQRARRLGEKAKGSRDIEGKRIGVFADIGANGGGPREQPGRVSGRSLFDGERRSAVYRFELVPHAPLRCPRHSPSDRRLAHEVRKRAATEIPLRARPAAARR